MMIIKRILPAFLLLTGCTSGGQTGELTDSDSIDSTGMTPEEVAEKFLGNYAGLLGDRADGEFSACEGSIEARVELEVLAGEGTPPDGEYLDSAQLWLNVVVVVSVDGGSPQQVGAALSEFGDVHFHEPEDFEGILRGMTSGTLRPERGEAVLTSSEMDWVPLCCGSPLPQESQIYESLSLWEQPPLLVSGSEGTFAAGGDLLDLQIHVEPLGDPTSCLVMAGALDPVRLTVVGSDGFEFAELEGNGSAFMSDGVTNFYANGSWADPTQSGAALPAKGTVDRVFVTLTLDREGQILERCVSLDIMDIDDPDGMYASGGVYNTEVLACAVTCPDAEDCPELPETDER